MVSALLFVSQARENASVCLRWAAHYQSREFGGSALYGKHGDEQTRFSEEYQAGLYRHQLASLRKTPSLAGMSPWVLDGFSFAAAVFAGGAGFSQPEGVGFG